MTLNAYEKAQKLGLRGSDAENVAALQTLTMGPIDPQSVRQWSRENMLWYRKPNGAMGGMWATAYPAATPTQKAALDQFFAAIWGDSLTVLHTNELPLAQTIWGLVQQIASLNPTTAAQLVDSFYALDGGRPYKDTTVTEYASQRADFQRLRDADNWLAAAMNEIISPAASDPERTLASLRAAVAAAAVMI
jgi:hypothetical protein